MKQIFSLGEVHDFLDFIFAKLQEVGIDASDLELDHLAYQASSNEDYDLRKNDFVKFTQLKSEEIVGGRRVSIFQLNDDITHHDRIINAIELIAPKQGQQCPSALEHVEFVIRETFTELMNLYPELDWDVSAIAQPDFPMIKLKLSNSVQVKFHYEPVLKIIADKYKEVIR